MKFIFNFTFLIINILLLICALKIDRQDVKLLLNGNYITSDNIKTAASILTSITAIINIFLVILFYNLGLRKSREESLLTKKSFWFRDLILEPNKSLIDEVFSESLTMAKDLKGKDDDHYMETFLKLKESLTDFNNIFIEMIKVTDEGFAIHLEKGIERYEDNYVENAIKILSAELQDRNAKEKDLVTYILIEKKKFYNLLYSYEISNYKYTSENNQNWARKLLTKFKKK